MKANTIKRYQIDVEVAIDFAESVLNRAEAEGARDEGTAWFTGYADGLREAMRLLDKTMQRKAIMEYVGDVKSFRQHLQKVRKRLASSQLPGA
jgi:hypothetical protein